jgi:aspartokinase-like uncharacterized kinase
VPTTPFAPGPTVVKVGGSLYDLPDLGGRLRRWLGELPARHVLLVPGGGAAADAVRDFDRLNRLDEDTSHWLALRALTVNAHALAALLRPAEVVTAWGECPAAWRRGGVAVADCHAFLAEDESRPDHLPHGWHVTSDSVAARLARLGGAGELILLKSVDLPPGADWGEACRLGAVDEYFAEAVRGAALRVRAVNFRAWRPVDG